MATPKLLSNSIYSNGDIVFDCKRSKREFVQEIMFVNMCVKFRDNRIRNKKFVKFNDDLVFCPQKVETRTLTRDDVCERV